MNFQLISHSKVLLDLEVRAEGCNYSNHKKWEPFRKHLHCVCEPERERNLSNSIYHRSTVFQVAHNFNKLFNLSTVHPQLLCTPVILRGRQSAKILFALIVRLQRKLRFIGVEEGTSHGELVIAPVDNHLHQWKEIFRLFSSLKERRKWLMMIFMLFT